MQAAAARAGSSSGASSANAISALRMLSSPFPTPPTYCHNMIPRGLLAPHPAAGCAILPATHGRREGFPMEQAAGSSRSALEQAAAFFLATVERVEPTQWDLPGLGEWSVRDLVGHTGRA